MHVRKMLLACLGVMFLLGTSLVGSSGAAGTFTITPSAVPVTANQKTATVTASWTGQATNTLMFLRVCKKSIADPSFDSGFDCSLLSEQTPNGTADGARTIQQDVFRSENPDGDSGWGCFAPGDTPPAGITKYTTCYVRLTSGSIGNNADDIEQPFTFVVGGDVVPEAPIGILLPMVGAVAALGGFFFLRRRAAVS
jgi:hypothetical protein